MPINLNTGIETLTYFHLNDLVKTLRETAPLLIGDELEYDLYQIREMLILLGELQGDEIDAEPILHAESSLKLESLDA